MLNKCPRIHSCGSNLSYWTNDVMPKAVGIATNIYVYSSASKDGTVSCKKYSLKAQVMRCSLKTDHDFVYKFNDELEDDEDLCAAAFCGME